jgi:hypothetical protein
MGAAKKNEKLSCAALVFCVVQLHRNARIASIAMWVKQKKSLA